VAAALVGTMALPVSAQNLAIVNGKAVPKSAPKRWRSRLPSPAAPSRPKCRPDQGRSDRPRNLHAGSPKARPGSHRRLQAQMELARQTILIRELFADFQKKNPVTDAEIKAEYDKFVAANSGKEYKASHILVEKEDEAKAIIARLKKGGKFDDIAKKQSKDPGSGAKGGDLDWANASSYVPEFTRP
jgi:peptidyl-prolyl cis-trans isomerase C